MTSQKNEIDLRLVRVGIEVNGKTKIYEDLDIKATGTKYANPNKNDCEIKIANLNQETLDYILTETSPFNKNKTSKRLFIDAGRKSYGVTRIFSGNISYSSPSQPPDVVLTLNCVTGYFQQGDTITRNYGQIQLSDVSKNVANDLGVSLNFQAKDKTIYNYTHSGSASAQIAKVQDLGGVNAYIDNDTLIVKDINSPLPNSIKILDSESGMIGIPEMTEQGIKVKFLLDNKTQLGGLIRIKSDKYKAANGDYVIYKLGFEITNRAIPFYFIAEGKRL